MGHMGVATQNNLQSNFYITSRYIPIMGVKARRNLQVTSTL